MKLTRYIILKDTQKEICPENLDYYFLTLNIKKKKNNNINININNFINKTIIQEGEDKNNLITTLNYINNRKTMNDTSRIIKSNFIFSGYKNNRSSSINDFFKSTNSSINAAIVGQTKTKFQSQQDLYYIKLNNKHYSNRDQSQKNLLQNNQNNFEEKYYEED